MRASLTMVGWRFRMRGTSVGVRGSLRLWPQKSTGVIIAKSAIVAVQRCLFGIKYRTSLWSDKWQPANDQGIAALLWSCGAARLDPGGCRSSPRRAIGGQPPIAVARAGT